MGRAGAVIVMIFKNVFSCFLHKIFESSMPKAEGERCLVMF